MTRSPYAAVKRLRVIIAIAFAAVYAILFLDIRHDIPPETARVLGSLQFIPVVMKALLSGGGALVGVGALLLLTLSYGRIYCSTFCPLGTLQDVVIRLARKMNKRKRFQYSPPPYRFHYAALGVAILLVLSDSAVLLNLFEPYSNFGRMVNVFAAPFVMAANNGLAAVLDKSGIPFLVPTPLRVFAFGALGGSFLFLAGLLYLSYTRGRFFCNTLCPAGAALGMLSRFSWFRPVFNNEACNDCGACELVCKSQCVDVAKRTIDDAACVGCFNCMISCPRGGLEYRPRYSGQKPAHSDVALNLPTHNQSRRNVLTGAMGAAVMIGKSFGPESLELLKMSGYDESRRHPVTPPGSLALSHYTTLCTACHMCVTACPSQVLTPAFLEYGAAGIFQPKMNYDSGYCGYECTACGTVCPTGAILPLNVATKKLTQVGRTMFIRADCVVVSKNKDCGACSEHCPTKAVNMVPYSGTLKIPEVNDDVCIGCGACEHACPTTPRKAIYVRALAHHRTASPPIIHRPEKSFDSSQEFPF